MGEEADWMVDRLSDPDPGRRRRPAVRCGLCHGAHDEDSACPPVPAPKPLGRPSLVGGDGRHAVRDPGGGRSHEFEARYASTCPGCSTRIRPGDTAVMLDGEALHKECADEFC